jgi:hypothetical protein
VHTVCKYTFSYITIGQYIIQIFLNGNVIGYFNGFSSYMCLSSYHLIEPITAHR